MPDLRCCSRCCCWVSGRCPSPASRPLGEPVVTELVADLGVGRDDFTLDLGLQIGAGEVVALLAPNGAGKSTALRALAGLLRLTSGQITNVGRVVADSVSGVHLAPHKRPIGWSFRTICCSRTSLFLTR
jgi:translation initiation factor RLI1